MHTFHLQVNAISPVPEINGLVELRFVKESAPMAIKPIERCITFYEGIVQNDIPVNLSVIEREVFRAVFTNELRNDV